MSDSESSVLSRFFGILLRLAVVVVLGIGLAALAYFGVPRAYRGLVEPAEVNTDRIDTLESQLGIARDDTSALRDQTGERLAELEAALAVQGEALATAQTQLESALEDAVSQSRALNRLTSQVGKVEGSLSGLSDQIDAAFGELGQPDEELRQDLLVNRAMLHLIRARLGLLENNAGLAASEAGLARALLEGTDPDSENERIQDAISRIDLALEAMQTTPLVAGDDLEIAWKLLVGEETPSD